MKQFLIILCCLFAISSLCEAQNEKEKINSIKLDENYISAEASDANKDMAKKAAIANLSYIIQSVCQVNCDSVKLVHAVSAIEVKRGELIRVFVYLKTSDIGSLGAATENTAAQKPSSQPVISHPVISQPTTANRHVIFRPRIPEIVKNIMTTNDAIAVRSTLIAMKDEGRVTDFGSCSKGGIPRESYIIVYDRSHKVKAVLGPDDGKGRSNLNTNQSDAMTNYSGCGAIWFTVE